MNQIWGVIEQITSHHHLSLVRIQSQGVNLTAIVIDTPTTCTYLNVGQHVQVIFKETEVIIGTGRQHNISLQNQLPGQIVNINQAKLLSQVKLETNVGLITSIITSRAVQQLQLDIGTNVMAMIKTNEVMLAP